MEELDKIDWSYDIPDNQHFINDESNFDKSATFQLIKGTFKNPFLSSDSDQDGAAIPKKSKSKKKKKNKAVSTIKPRLEYIPGFRSLPLYPQTSSLTPEQHKICNNVLRFINTNSCSMPRTVVNQNELKIYTELVTTIKEEQKLFNDHIKELWTKKNCGRHLQMFIAHEKFIETVWKDQLTRVKKYPQFYQMATMLPLVYTNENPIGISLLGCLKNENNPPHIETIVLSKGTYLPKSQSEIASSLASVIDTSKNHVSVSDDEVCEQLAIQHKANIVISSSGLKTLADNHAPFTRFWDLPVLVKDYKLTDGHGKIITHTVAYVDRSLPPRQLTGYQKSSWCSKLLLKSVLLQKNNKIADNESTQNITPKIEYCKNCKQFAEAGISKSTNDKNEKVLNEVIIDDDNLTSDSESENLIIDIPVAPTRRMTRGMTRKCAKSNDPPDPKSPITPNTKEISKSATLDNDNDNKECTCGTNVMEKSASEDVSNTIADILKLSVETEIVQQDKTKSSEKNISYKLWKIGPTQQESQLSKTLEKDIIVLVRCKIDGTQIGDDGNSEALMFAPKLEYQVEFGVESVTRSETARNWISLQFRPDTKLLRARLLPLSGEIIMVEKLSLPALWAEALKHNSWKPQAALGCFLNIFTPLSNLHPGQYLLRHEPTHHSFAMVCASTPTRTQNGIDLYQNYDIDPATIQVNQSAQWNPIDPSVVTPNLAHHCVMPCMFTPGTCKTIKKPKAVPPKKKFKSKGITKFNRKRR